MKTKPASRSACPALVPFLSVTLLAAAAATAADATAAPVSWHAQTLGEALLQMLIFAVVGIAVAIAGYKIFDRCTPGDLHREILEQKNVAAAIVAAAAILGVSLITAAAMLG